MTSVVRKRERGISYLLERIPSDPWHAAKARAAKEGHTLRWVLLQMLATYAKDGLETPKVKRG
jgi:hypothetical protein